MAQYTEKMQHMLNEISIENDDYMEQLLLVVESFRSFDQALDAFLIQRGFVGEIDNVEEKVSFIKQKFQGESIAPFPRNLKEWFTKKKRMEKRKIAFQFCFAFKLNLEECEKFFQTVCLQRGFDCHNMQEAIYYYGICNGLSYTEVEEMIQEVPEIEKGKIDKNEEVLFTKSIVKEIHRARSKEELLQFLKDNQKQFTYHNATAYQYIEEIWNRIEKPNGLANKERALLFPKFLSKQSINLEENKRSVWEIYLQILGLYDLDHDNSPLFVIHTDRTLKPILKNNEILHPLAEDSFPDRQGLQAILRGDYKSNELVRKMMILLVFYKYWTSLLIKKGDKYYRANENDGKRCYAEINRYLVDSGYPILYVGNPYDWIFLFAIQDEYPMETFRYFIRELYMRKEDELVAKK